MRNLIALIFGLSVGLLGLEAVVRLFEYASTTPQWNDRPKYYFRPERSSTMQDYPVKLPKPDNAFRIAVVGDSFSFAPYMQFTDAFPKILERMLNLNDVALRAEVVNYGVPAYSTSHEIATVKRAIAEEADLILLQITLNDPELKPYRPIGITVFDKFGEFNPQGVLGALSDYWHTGAMVMRRLHNERTRQNYINYFLDLYEPKQAPWKQFKQSLRSLVKVARKGKVPIYAVVFPLFGMPLDDTYPFVECHERIERVLKRLDVPLLDLFESYRNIPTPRLQVMPGVDRHPNEIGHRIAAERIYDWLTEVQQVVPNDLVIRHRYTDRTRIKDVPVYKAASNEGS